MNQLPAHEEDEYALIERPLPMHQQLRFGSDVYDPDFEIVKNDWSYIPMIRLWSHGYNKSVLLTWFHSFPPELVSILRMTLGIVQQTLVARISHLETFSGISKDFSCQAEPYTEEMERLWCEQAPHAGVRIRYDPSSQARISVSVNMMHADLLQMHPEEYMARVANHDMLLPMPAVDFLCLALDDILQFSVDRLNWYVRYRLNGQRKVKLVFISKIRRYNSIGQVFEMQHLGRQISPEEYDHALRYTPSMCPLVMLGDWRSGRELLEQADHDFRTGLGQSWRIYGQNLMQYMSWKYRILQETLYQQGPEGPAPASPRSIHPNDPPHLPSDDPPSACAPARPAPSFMHIPARWARGPLQHLWALGYQRELAALLDALPPALLDPLRRALAALDSLDARRRAALRAAHTADAIAAADCCRGAAGDGAGGVDADWDGLGDPGALWEAEAEAGFVSVGYDGATGRRVCVGMNRRQAELLGARRGAALRRIAARAVPLPAPQADVLACVAHELDRPAQARTEQYLRGAVGVMATGALLHRVQATSFDALGRVTRVSYATRVIGAAEYDAAVMENPSACPLYLAGDLRSGRQLLEDFSSDRRHTISSMASVRRPSAVLRRLSIALAGVCARLESAADDAAAAQEGAAAAGWREALLSKA